MFLTLGSGFLAIGMRIKYSGWHINPSKHAKWGEASFMMGLILMAAGILANTVRLKINAPWNTKWVLLIGKAHKYFAWIVIIVSQVAWGTGCTNFYGKNLG